MWHMSYFEHYLVKKIKGKKNKKKQNRSSFRIEKPQLKSKKMVQGSVTSQTHVGVEWSSVPVRIPTHVSHHASIVVPLKWVLIRSRKATERARVE